MPIKNRKVPIQFQSHGFRWCLMSIKWDFSKIPHEIVSAEYENQYGQMKQLDATDMPITPTKAE
jgi:hypothetical protein